MLTLVRKALYLAAGHRRWPWLLVIALALVVSVVEAIGALLVFGLLRLMTAPTEAIELPLFDNLRPVLGVGDASDNVVTVAILVAAFFVARALIIVGTTYVQARVTQSAGARLAYRLHQGYLSMPYVLHVRTNSSDQIRNIQDTVPRVVADVFVQGARAVSESIVVVVLGLVLVIASPVAMALLLLVVAPGVLALNRYVRPRLEALGRATQDLSGQSLQLLQETLQGLREIRVHGREQYFASVFASIRHKLAQTRYRRTVFQMMPSPVLETALVLFMAAFLVFTIFSGQDTADVLPVLGMFAYVGFRLKPSLNQVVDGVNAIRYSAAAIDDLFDDLRSAESWALGEDEVPVSITFEQAIELSGVVFRYQDAPMPALAGIDLVIRRGTSVGFVGPTGGGKSTLLDVIIGLLEPDEGTVRVDGVDIRQGKLSWLQRLGVVPQTTFLLDTTLRRNIALGVPDIEIDQQRLEAALALAKLDEFVASLPAGVETMLGERGVRLSGGQRQRVAIARALYSEPEVLILDEGTAALDNRTEDDLMSGLGRLRGSCTLLIVAHRLTTVRNCDVVHVVEGGHIVASGPYSELVRDSRQFKDLAR